MKLPEVGTLFQSKYRLESELGAGGFATVFKALDVAADRAVAIKILRPELRGYSATVTSRFEREVRVIASLRDPHTIKLFEFGTSVEGLLFMVTEYVPGEDLLEVLHRRGRLEPPEVVHIMQQVLSSLREAHNAGLLHRDIKPANIRIYEYMGDPLRVKVLDFGIAKPLQNDKQGITADGEIVGTLRYMSPEQLLSAELAPSSDIYSLGVVAFEMLLGATGIHGNRLADQMERLVTGHVFSIPELQRIGPELSRVLDKMAARDQSQRYRVVDEVMAALQHVPRGAFSGPLPAPSWTGSPPQGVRRSEELLPPSTGPHTGPAAMLPHSGVTPTTGSLDIPRPVPMTDPAFELPRAANSNRQIIVIAAALIALIVVLTGAAIRIGTQDEAPEQPAPSAKKRASSFIKGTQQPEAPPAPAPEVVVDEPEPPEVAEAEPDAGNSTGSAGCGLYPSFVGMGELRVQRGIDLDAYPAYIPSDYDPQRTYPLVVMFHENFESPSSFMTYSTMRDLAEKHRFVILAPNGGSPMAWSGHRWERRIETAIKGTLKSLCIDTTRIFALGHAAGGRMVENAPCELPYFRAIATTSYRGSPVEIEDLCDPNPPVPYLHIAPLHDKYNPVEGGKSCSGARKISLADKEEMWREKQGCGTKRSTWRRIGKNTCYTWDCDVEFVSCHLDGGRPWPGQGTRLADKFSGNNCDGESADFPYAETIWKFFEAHAPTEQ